MKLAPVTLTGEEFRDIFNASLTMMHELDSLEDILSSHVLRRMRKVNNDVRQAIKRAMDEKDAENDRRSKHYERMAKILGVGSVWSMYEVSYLEDKLPYSATTLEYDGLSKDISDCKTWIDLWERADELIIESGDDHHIFIEGFHEMKGGEVLKLQTGS